MDTAEIQHLSGVLCLLQGVSTLDLGQDTVMRAADQEVVQPMQRAEFKPSSTVCLPSDMPRHVYEVCRLCLPIAA